MTNFLISDKVCRAARETMGSPYLEGSTGWTLAGWYRSCMRITLRLVGFLASIGLPNGFKGGEVNLQKGASIKDVLNTIGLTLPTQNLIVRNGRLAGLEEILKDGDIIQIVPPIDGG